MVSSLLLILFILCFGVIFQVFRINRKLKLLGEQVKFHNFEIPKLQEYYRLDKVANLLNEKQTLDSFDYQWTNYNRGKFLSDDSEFMKSIKETIVSYTNLPSEWFNGKRVLDLGAGSGRFTYGFLTLGSKVTAVEQSQGGCKAIRELCKEYHDKLNVIQKNIITDELPKEFDFVFCYGVVHHTGNTYLAIKKACNSVKKGGKIFLMVYGYPNSLEDFSQLNCYEELRQETRNLTFSEKIKYLEKKYPRSLVHGYFDAISPKENDLLRYQELVDVLTSFGIGNIQRTLEKRNLHIVGEKL